jgi:hypothetical protein
MSRRYIPVTLILLVSLAASACHSSSSGGGAPATTTGTTTVAKGPSLQLESTGGVAGDKIEASGSGFDDSSHVEIFLDSGNGMLLSAAEVSDGAFKLDLAIPVNAIPGLHTVIAKGVTEDDGGNKAASGEEASQSLIVALPDAPVGPYDRRIHLKNRVILTADELNPDFVEEIRNATSGTTHAIVQLESLPRNFRRVQDDDGVYRALPANDLGTLKELGIEILEYLGAVDGIGTAYVAAIASSVAIDDERFGDMVRALVRLEPDDKVQPALLQALPLPEPDEPVEGGDGIVDVAQGGAGGAADPMDEDELPRDALVQFHADVTAAAAESTLADAEVDATGRAPSLWEVSATPTQLRALIEQDEVQFVELAPEGFLPTVDEARAASEVDAVHVGIGPDGMPVGLSGAGIRIGIMDNGIDSSHGDLVGKILQGLAPETDHGTQVAGVAVGTGARSDGSDDEGQPNGEDTAQWRGVAPRSNIAAFGGAYGKAEVYDDAINGLGVDVTNHSYVLQVQGFYGADVASVDGIAREDGVRIPGRPSVWAAGNNASISTRDCSGVEMEAPVVTGVVALMLEQYAETYDVNIDPPLTSMVKAVLVQTGRRATDWSMRVRLSKRSPTAKSSRASSVSRTRSMSTPSRPFPVRRSCESRSRGTTGLVNCLAPRSHPSW